MRTIAVVCCSLFVFAGTSAAQPKPVGGEYDFSVNWTALNAKRWNNNLKKLKGKPNAQGLEVGCFEGRSTIWFLANILTHPTSRMTCIDVFTEGIEARFDNNVKVSGLAKRVIKKKGYSQDVLRTLPVESYDFAYIDGCHLASCALTDAVMTWELIKPGGIIIFDDYDWHMNDPPSKRPKIAFDAFIESFIDQIEVRHIGRQLIVKKLESAGRNRDNLVGKPMVHSEEWEKKQQQRQRQGKSAP